MSKVSSLSNPKIATKYKKRPAKRCSSGAPCSQKDTIQSSGGPPSSFSAWSTNLVQLNWICFVLRWHAFQWRILYLDPIKRQYKTLKTMNNPQRWQLLLSRFQWTEMNCGESYEWKTPLKFIFFGLVHNEQSNLSQVDNLIELVIAFAISQNKSFNDFEWPIDSILWLTDKLVANSNGMSIEVFAIRKRFNNISNLD